MSAIFPTDKWKDTQREKWSWKYHRHWQPSHPSERQISVSTNTKGFTHHLFLHWRGTWFEVPLAKWDHYEKMGERLWETQNWWFSIAKPFFLPHTIKSLAASDINLYHQQYEVPGVKLLHHSTDVKLLLNEAIQAILPNLLNLLDFSSYFIIRLCQ